MQLAKALFVAATTVCAVPAFAKDTPEGRTEQLIATFKQVHVPPDNAPLTAAEKQANAAVYKALEPYFDFDRITSAAIAPHSRHFNTAQLTRYRQIFGELIRRVAFPKSGAFARQASMQFDKAKALDGKVDVTVRAHVPEDDIETSVTFAWEAINAHWLVTDVRFNDVSVVKDYQNQFGKLINKDGPEGFLKRLDTRLAQKRQADD